MKMKVFGFPLVTITLFQNSLLATAYSLLNITALLDIHYDVLSFRIGIFNQENIGTDNIITYTYVVNLGIMCIEVYSK